VTDLRLPIGIFFALLAVLLLITPASKAPLTEIPINTYAGVAMLIFAGAMLWLSRRRKS
jgi:hypothetical protein